MQFESSVQNGCPICGKDTTLATIEHHPTHPERELHTYQCIDCGPVRTKSHPQRDRILTRAA
jgi:uncharacterized Zn finger protein